VPEHSIPVQNHFLPVAKHFSPVENDSKPAKNENLGGFWCFFDLQKMGKVRENLNSLSE
jgi:hypothetical protein